MNQIVIRRKEWYKPLDLPDKSIELLVTPHIGFAYVHKSALKSNCGVIVEDRSRQYWRYRYDGENPDVFVKVFEQRIRTTYPDFDETLATTLHSVIQPGDTVLNLHTLIVSKLAYEFDAAEVVMPINDDPKSVPYVLEYLRDHCPLAELYLY